MRSVSAQAATAQIGALLLFCGIVSASSHIRDLLQVQATTELLQPDGKLLKSMHCFDKGTGVWLDSADWKPSSDFLVGFVVDCIRTQWLSTHDLATHTCI